MKVYMIVERGTMKHKYSFGTGTRVWLRLKNAEMAAKKRSGHVTKYDVVEYDISQVEPKIIEVV